MSASEEIKALLALDKVKGSLAAIRVLDDGELNQGELAAALGIADQTAGRIRTQLTDWGLVHAEAGKIRGATVYTMKLTPEGRRAGKDAASLARIIMKNSA